MYTKLDFYRTNKPRNNTGIVTEGVKSYPNCLIKGESGVVRPTVRINFTTADGIREFLSSRYNYMHWEDVGRYYYIEEITLITATVVEIDCVVDPLASFQEDIHNTYAFVQYSEKDYNTMIPDSRLHMTDRSTMYGVETKALLSTTGGLGGCFIVTIATPDANGQFGPVQAYALSEPEVRELSKNLYADDFIDRLAKLLLSPADAVVSCIWLPIDQANASSGGTVPITVLGYKLTDGAPCTKTYEREVEIEPYVHYRSPIVENGIVVDYNYADFRNCEPYSEYVLWLPGVGLTQIPMISLIGTGVEHPKFKVSYCVGVTSGDITYTIKRVNDVDAPDNADTVLVVKGNFGVTIPVAKGENSLGGALASFVAMAGSIAIVALAPESAPVIAAGASVSAGASMISTVGQSLQQSYGAVGALGGWAQTKEQLQNFYTITKVKELSDSPSNVADVIGRPLFKRVRLGELDGLVRCTGAFVRPDGATDEEQRMIAQYVNSSANFIFGGLIICNGSYDG